MFLLLRGKELWNQLILIIFLLLDKCCVQSLALSVTKRRAKKNLKGHLRGRGPGTHSPMLLKGHFC